MICKVVYKLTNIKGLNKEKVWLIAANNKASATSAL